MMRALTCVVILCCTCITGILSYCYSSGPGDCSFGYSTCGWTTTSGWRFYFYYGYHLGLRSNHKHLESVESRRACSTNNDVHCLKFSYKIEEGDDMALSVIVKAPGMDERELWRMSGPPDWEEARVPVNITTEFNVIFDARSPDNHRIYIDDIDYDKEFCELYPQEAAPTTTSTTTTTTTTITSSSTTSTEPSSDVGLIVGVVVAVVCLVVVGVVLCILFRQKQLSCTQQKQKEEVFRIHASHNAAYNHEENDPDQFIHVDMNRASHETNPQQHRDCDTTVVPSPADSYYSVIKSPSRGTGFQLSGAEYPRANKQNKFNDQQGHQSSDASPYEISDTNEVIASVPSAQYDSYNKLNFHSQGHDVFLPSTVQTSDYNHLVSNDTETRTLTDKDEGRSSRDRDDEEELYQNTDNISKTRDQQAASALYQNVPGIVETPAHDPREDSDLPIEDKSAGVYHTPKGTTTSKYLGNNTGD